MARFRTVFSSSLLLLVLASMGCRTPLQQAAGAPAGNPMFVAANNESVVWERTVDVLHDFRFEIARENKLDGIIETEYKVGSSLLEPWHRDSVGKENKLESTFQSIRRRAFVSVTAAEGGFLVSVEAFKELEDLAGLAANSAGGATFQESTPLQRDLNLVVGQSAPSGWIPLGRDIALEQEVLNALRTEFLQ